jgi:hypothetical protein
MKALEGINWKLLSEQKNTLVALACSNLLSPEKTQDLDGIISLLDAIQDEVVTEGIAPEKNVFPARDKHGVILEVGMTVEVCPEANSMINAWFSGTVVKIKDNGDVIVADQEDDHYTVDCPNDYLEIG